VVDKRCPDKKEHSQQSRGGKGEKAEKKWRSVDLTDRTYEGKFRAPTFDLLHK